LSRAIIVPRLPPVSDQLNVALRPPLVDCPVPKPVVVQPATVIANSDAAAALIDKAVIVSLLSNLKRKKWDCGSHGRSSAFVRALSSPGSSWLACVFRNLRS